MDKFDLFPLQVLSVDTYKIYIENKKWNYTLNRT